MPASLTRFLLPLFLLPLILSAQSLPLGKDDLVLQGFAQKTGGMDISYHSPLPGVGEAMIVRAEDGKQTMRWQTEALPSRIEAPYVTFIWLAGLGCNLGEVRMDLQVAGLGQLSFYVDAVPNWEVKGPQGVALHYRNVMVDGSRDQFGFMFLRVPRDLLTPGQPLALSVTGGRFNSQAWYMTFKASLKPGMELVAFPALVKGKQRQQAIAVNVYHFQAPTTARVYANGKLWQELDLSFGHNYFSFSWPEVKKTEKVRFSLKSDAFEQEQEVTFEPVQQWHVDFLQHSHTDIGYTRPQTEILAEHLRYIDYALDYCDATDSYPDDARFRWTCEAAWAVDEYLKSRPQAQIARLKQRISEGRIEVTGMYFNFDELPDEQTLAASLAPMKRFREQGIEVKLAMQNDVNGTGWAFNDYFNSVGIRYLDMGTHGHKALICFDKPTAFWWESPSGNRILAFRSEHYMYGNTVMNIHTRDFKLFESKLMTYLVELGKKGYPHDRIMIQHSGYLTDNSPPSTRSSDMIRQWNEKYEWPKLRAIVASEFFEAIEADHGADLPVYRVAWPDWWTDGFGSAAREVAATRDAHVDIIASQGALAMASLLGAGLPAGISERIAETNKAILFYGEHTLGSSESIRDPYGTMTMSQRRMKESFAWEANRRAKMVGEEAMGVLQEFFSKTERPSLLVFNTLNWQREGLVEVYIDHEVLPLGKRFRIVDGQGQAAPVQALGNRSDGTYWGIWVKDVPALGVKKYFIEVTEEDLPAREALPEEQVRILENDWYQLTVDPERGAISSLLDKELKRELVDSLAPWGLGEFIHESLGNRSQLERFTLYDYQRSGLDTLWYEGFEAGDIWNTLRFKGEKQTFFSPNGFEIEIRLFNTTKRLDLKYEVIKKPITEPEGLYLAFPFTLDSARIFSEVPGGVMQAGVDQLPGSSNDWNTVQYFAAVRNEAAQIVWGSHECPLVQYGGINTGRFLTGATPGSSHIFSWPMNNYWTTNFNADQRGGHEWSYYLTSSADVSNRFATQFGWGTRVPFPARVLPAGAGGGQDPEGSLLQGLPANVLLVAARPEEGGSGIWLQLRELEGKESEIRLYDRNGRELEVEKVNVVGGELSDSHPKLLPLENAFFRVGAGNR